MSEATLRDEFNPAKTYGVTFVLAFLASYVFGTFFGPNPTIALGVGAGAAAGVFWVAGSLWTNDLFERRPLALTAINGAYHIVKFILIGLSFACCSPSTRAVCATACRLAAASLRRFPATQ